MIKAFFRFYFWLKISPHSLNCIGMDVIIKGIYKIEAVIHPTVYKFFLRHPLRNSRNPRNSPVINIDREVIRNQKGVCVYMPIYYWKYSHFSSIWNQI